MISHADDFAKYVASLWSGSFKHRYAITKHLSWGTWRSMCPSQQSPDLWSCSSLKEAADRYSWGVKSDNQCNLNYDCLSDQLCKNIEAGNDNATAASCCQIFAWGGVGRSPKDASVIWVDGQRKAKQLSKRLVEARKILFDPNASLKAFDGKHLLMNSAMTKVYAASCPNQLIIYDGRVGAALGLIARDYLCSLQHQGPVPDQLAFGWGMSRKKYQRGQKSERDPSEGCLVFPALFGVKKDKKHAEMMRNASRILCDVRSRLATSHSVSLSQLERALFMVGYDVSRRSEPRPTSSTRSC